MDEITFAAFEDELEKIAKSGSAMEQMYRIVRAGNRTGKKGKAYEYAKRRVEPHLYGRQGGFSNVRAHRRMKDEARAMLPGNPGPGPREPLSKVYAKLEQMYRKKREAGR